MSRLGTAFRGSDSALAAGPLATGEPVGLVAGWGHFPLEVTRALRSSGHPVHCIAIRGHASEELAALCHDVRWSGVGRLGGHIRYFRRQGIRSVTFAGKLFKADLLYRGSLWFRHFPDWTCIRTFAPHLLGRRRDARDDRLLLAVVAAYERAGITIVPATDFAPDLLAGLGILVGPEPSPTILRDIEVGWTVAKQMGGLDIGQSVGIKDGTVIAVEAIEGTDACIDRCGQLCPRGGWTLVKVSKPGQDMRFDVPTVGPRTVRRVHAAGGVAVAIEACKTILVESDQTLRAARRHGITIVAHRPSESGESGESSESSESRPASRANAAPDLATQPQPDPDTGQPDADKGQPDPDTGQPFPDTPPARLRAAS